VIQNRTNEVNKINSEISQTCPHQVSVVNGDVKVDCDSTWSTIYYFVKCDDGFQLVGEGVVAFVDGAFTSLATCQVKPSSSSACKTSPSFDIIQLILITGAIFKTM